MNIFEKLQARYGSPERFGINSGRPSREKGLKKMHEEDVAHHEIIERSLSSEVHATIKYIASKKER